VPSRRGRRSPLRRRLRQSQSIGTVLSVRAHDRVWDQCGPLERLNPAPGMSAGSGPTRDRLARCKELQARRSMHFYVDAPRAPPNHRLCRSSIRSLTDRCREGEAKMSEMRSSDRLRCTGSGSERISWFEPGLALAGWISNTPPSQCEDTAEGP
jgi:hypothetical protein